jgi:hypothetical protein
MTETRITIIIDKVPEPKKGWTESTLFKVSIIIGLTITILGILGSVVYGQLIPDAKSKTFTDCNNDVKKMSDMIFINITITDSEITELKQYGINLCNFYYEKQGVYPDIWSYEYIITMQQYKQEFHDKILSKLSPDLKEKLKVK